LEKADGGRLMVKIAPSILSADIGDLDRVVAALDRGQADVVHIDVMDGHFVPNLSFGIPVIEALAKRTKLPLDVHLMVDNPASLLDDYVRAGADWISVHWEAASHLHRLLNGIRNHSVRAGLALNPATPIDVVRDCVETLDFVLLMSVNPGFSGQSFIPQSLSRAERLRELLAELDAGEIEIQMDGGIGASNIGQIAAVGVDICVSGSGVFGQADPAEAIRNLRSLAEARE